MKNEQDGVLQKLSLPLILVCVAVLVMGTDACREDYFLGTQTTENTPTITITPDDGSDDDDDEVATSTPTATPTVIGDADEVPIEPTPTVTPTPAENQLGAPAVERDSLLNSLSTLGEADAKRPSTPGKAAQKLETSNWLGQAFQKKSEDEQLVPPAPLGAVQN